MVRKINKYLKDKNINLRAKSCNGIIIIDNITSIFDDDEEMSKPTCLAVEYEYESVLHEICNALGWQGGTIHQVVSEIKRLKEKDV